MGCGAKYKYTDASSRNYPRKTGNHQQFQDNFESNFNLSLILKIDIPIIQINQIQQALAFRNDIQVLNISEKL